MKQWLKDTIRPYLGHSWVLMYHRIDTAVVDPWDLAVRPDVFEAQLAWLKKNRKVLPLPELVQRWKEGRLEKHSVAISFDDGYLDNLTTALPLLERYEVPATFFLCTQPLASGEGYWWDVLQDLVLEGELPADFAFEWEGRSFPASASKKDLSHWRYPQPPPDERSKLYLDLWEELRRLDHATRCSLLQRWAGAAGRPVRPIPVINQAQARALAHHPLITIGAHTVTHCALQFADPEQQEEEMRGSKQELQAWTGQSPSLIANPYGSYSPETFSIAKRLGFDAGFTTQSVAANKASGAWSIGRLMVTNGSRLATY